MSSQKSGVFNRLFGGAAEADCCSVNIVAEEDEPSSERGAAEGRCGPSATSTDT